MGTLTKHKPVKLIIGLIAREDLFEPVEKILRRKFGIIDFKSEILDFNFTDYYQPEMGIGLKRRFLSFKQKILPRDLSRIKVYTNHIEKKFSKNNGSRQINIDPGYLTLAKLVLATTKDYQHRLYLDQGIFAEVTLRFQGKTFTSWEWTYPDYRSPAYINIFNHIRNNLLSKGKSKNA